MLNHFTELDTGCNDYYPAVYVIMFEKTNKIYVGVTSNAYRRSHNVRTCFSYNRTLSKALLNEYSKCKEYKFLVYKAKSFEEAILAKKIILDCYKESELLLNKRLDLNNFNYWGSCTKEYTFVYDNASNLENTSVYNNTSIYDNSSAQPLNSIVINYKINKPPNTSIINI